jgi:hypothetical protein
MLKIVLFLTVIGHVLCGVCDCRLGYLWAAAWNVRRDDLFDNICLNRPKWLSD